MHLNPQEGFSKYLFCLRHGAKQECYTVKKKASRNSDVDNGGANQTTWGSENFYSHVVWFCATVVNIGIWRIPTWLFYSVWKRYGEEAGVFSARMWREA
jgi:hypothetical protein